MNNKNLNLREKYKNIFNISEETIRKHQRIIIPT